MHLLFHCQERHNCHCWHHYLPPSNFTKWTLSGVLGHIKNHFFPSINMHFSLTLFLNQLWVDVFFTKLQHSGGRSVRADAAPHNTPQNTSCEQWNGDLYIQWKLEVSCIASNTHHKVNYVLWSIGRYAVKRWNTHLFVNIQDSVAQGVGALKSYKNQVWKCFKNYVFQRYAVKMMKRIAVKCLKDHMRD